MLARCAAVQENYTARSDGAAIIKSEDEELPHQQASFNET